MLGAGASVGFGVPTMNAFIDAADELRTGSRGHVSDAHFARFFDALQDRFKRLHAKSTINVENIESIFGLVEMARLLGRLPGFAKEEIEELAVSLRTVLLETIVHTGTFEFSREQRWLPPQEYLSLAGHFDRERQTLQGDDLAFVTFNYDLGLDFALHWSNLTIDYGLEGSPRDSVALYKLHGSLNWVACRACHAVRVVSMDNIFRSYAGARAIARDSARLSLDPRRAHSTLGPHCPEDHSPFDVCLVPPSWNKTQYWESLGSVWSAAARALSEAHEIVVIGYSLPESDSFFRDLLALGLEGPTRVKAFTVVNPDESVGGRFERLLGPEVRARFSAKQQSFANWVRENYGASPRVRTL